MKTQVQFVEKESYVSDYGVSGTGRYTPVCMVKNGREYLVRYIVEPLGGDSPQWRQYDHQRGIDETEQLKKQLIATGGKYCKFFGRDDSPFDFLTWVQENDYTLEAWGELFIENGEDGASITDFHGNLAEYSSAFSYRIYDRATVIRLKKITAEIKQHYHYKTRKEGSGMKDQFNGWLQGKKAHAIFTNGEEGDDQKCMEVMRVPARDGLAVIYYKLDYRADAPPLHAEFNYGGIYDKRTGAVYDQQYALCMHGIYSDPSDERTKSHMADAAQQRIRGIVDAALGNNRGNLRIKTIEEVTDESTLASYREYVKDAAASAARKAFLSDAGPEDLTVCCDYEGTDFPDADMLDWIIDAEGYCQRKAAEYLDAEQERLFTAFLKNDAEAAELQKIIDDPNHEAHMVKAIIAAIQGRDCRSVMVTVEIGGKELTFCTATGSLRCDPEGSYYSSLQIAAPDRVRFEEAFGRSAEYYPANVAKITYSRAVIYTRGAQQ